MLPVGDSSIYYGDGIVNGNGSGVAGVVETPGVESAVENGTFSANGDFQKVHSVITDGGDEFGVSAVAFDQQEELIWMGNQGGHVTSYYGANMEKYTSFQVVNNQEIRQILTLEDVVLILSQRQLRGQIRRGLPAFTHTSELMQEMQCMLQTSSTSVLLGGHQENLIDYDLQQNRETQTIYMGEAGCAILRNQGRYICAGQADGKIHLLDPRTLQSEQSLEAHTGSLSDFDVHGNLMVTCGFSSRHGSMNVDRFLKVYDIRILRAMAPISISIDPFLLRFLPSFSSRIACISPSGQMEIVESQAVSTASFMLYQVTSNASMCLSFDVASSCHHMAFGDSTGSLHLFSTSASTFNSFSRDTEFPDPIVIDHLPQMSVTDELACYASIPMPVTSHPLSSDWPSQFIQPGYRPPPEVDRQILQSMKMVGNIGYAPNPGTFRRNQIRYKTDFGGPSSPTKGNSNVTSGGHHHNNMSPSHLTSKGGFTNPIGGHNVGSTSPFMSDHNSSHLSPSHRGGKHHNHHHHPSAHGFHGKSGSGKFSVPKRYARFEWKKGSFEEADTETFNRTKFAGLEAITVNSYCNSMIQVLYHLDYLRRSLLNHLCKKEACLACELGFLFHMMDKSRTYPCLGSNFLRAFRVVPEASALGLILQENQSKQRSLLLRLIQSWNRFILHQIEMETDKAATEKQKDDSSENNEQFSVAHLFTMPQEYTNRCTRCGREEIKESIVLLSNLLYTVEATEGGKRCKFTEVLQRSLCPEQTTPAWCDKCEKYQATFQSRVPKCLPPFLSLNTCLDNAHDFQIWKRHLESALPEKPQVMKGPVNEVHTSPPLPPSPHPTMKSCRYGRNCMRPDCKFWHESRVTRDGEPVRLTEFDMNPETVVNWLPTKIRVKIEEGKILSEELQDTAEALEPEKVKANLVADYELVSVICFVRDAESEDRNNLVALLKVDPAYFQLSGQPESKTGWFLFNDFCVREIGAHEAHSFNPRWKIPAVVYYKKLQLPETIANPPEVKNIITLDVFKEESKPKESKKTKKVPFKPLKPDEIPKEGELVAMDAEFVTLGQEETELRSDGKLATVKPQQLTLARVTCIRTEGPLEGTPFMDDYISTQEVVVDYLTKFSGIQPGDLDANSSSKHVTGLKSAYLKLRYLVDSGVKFLGHGLKNDFRVINLLVPPEQVIDTVSLFFLPNQRMVSLRFLAWHFLGIVIQSEVHDSAEDARTALQLYRKYEELQAAGTLQSALQELYETGKKLQWKVPEESEKEKSKEKEGKK